MRRAGKPGLLCGLQAHSLITVHVCASVAGRFAGLSVRLYHPDSAPMDPLESAGGGGDRSGVIQV
jgi:hypothetical protein